MGYNHSLTNILLHHELKCLGWIGLWWWWFGMVWVILVSLMRIDWCVYSLILNPFAVYRCYVRNTTLAPAHRNTTALFAWLVPEAAVGVV